jgi:hypothetical protein
MYTLLDAKTLVETMLGDQNGVSETTYWMLDKFLEHWDIGNIRDQVRYNAISNRFYIPSDAEAFPLIPWVEVDEGPL